MNEHLKKIQEAGKFVTLYFVNGFQDRVLLLDFSVDWLLVQDQKGYRKLVFRHAVSTINMA